MKLIIKESQFRTIIENESELTELRKGHFNFVSQKIKELTGQNWPPYVVKDWLYKNTKDFNPDYESEDDFKNLAYEFINSFKESFGEGQWIAREISLDFNKFNEETKKMMKERSFGELNPYDINRDSERMDFQNKRLEQLQKPSEEPIILVQTSDGYDLIEGWHRTMAALKKFGEYKQNAYIYVPK